MSEKYYRSYTIAEQDVEKQEILIAQLADFGFSAFQQTNEWVSANADVTEIDDTEVVAFLSAQKLNFKSEIIEDQNWNEQWEQSFQPIVVDQFCAVRASFHQPIQNVEHEIIITPKMSFGTGHHATTFMMLQAMQKISIADKTVIDFGTGTGILAILAEKMGAATVRAIDNDDWCIENGNENIIANNCNTIRLLKASCLQDMPQADVMLANINRHIILLNLPEMKRKLKIDGRLLISGILQHSDESDILNAAAINGFYCINKVERNGWLCICFGCN